MYLVVGLGNPGGKYENTRHNVGFDVVDILAKELSISVTKARFQALYGEGRLDGHRVVLAKPQTFMNLSGESVREMCDWWKVEPERLILIYDDIDLPAGKLRVRAKGSAGTHNGMRSVIACLSSDVFPRVRVGIGRPPEKWNLADYVLSHYENNDAKAAAFEGYQKAAKLVQTIILQGVEKAAQQAGMI